MYLTINHGVIYSQEMMAGTEKKIEISKLKHDTIDNKQENSLITFVHISFKN